MTSLGLVIAAAGGGSSGFGGGGGGGGGGFGGGGGGGGFVGGGGDGGSGLAFFAVIVVFGLLVYFASKAARSQSDGGGARRRAASRRTRRKRADRAARVAKAAAEAAGDDAYFAADAVEREARQLFADIQTAWTDRDADGLARLAGEDLLVEWRRRLADFERRGWHNVVEIRKPAPVVEYLGLTNLDDEADDRVVVRITAKLRDVVLTREGRVVTHRGTSSDVVDLYEYWTLARRDGRWVLVSVEQDAEGAHHLDDAIVASPWAAEEQLEDASLVGLATADAPPEGFRTADLADLDFDGDARAMALDLSLADPRFAPDVLEASARAIVAGWAEAIDGADDRLLAVASPAAVDALLGGADGNTRVVVRGARVRRARVTSVDASAEPATVGLEVALRGRRYVEDRDTAAVLSGDPNRAVTRTQRWTLALDCAHDAPWRLVDVKH